MSELHRITVDPNQCGGWPCLRGLRVRVTDVLELLAAGASREEVWRITPTLKLATSRRRWSMRPAKPTIRCCMWRSALPG